MDEVTFHREPPAHLPTLVTAFTGWIDAGEAATDALRFLVRQLAAEPLATIDLADRVPGGNVHGPAPYPPAARHGQQH